MDALRLDTGVRSLQRVMRIWRTSFYNKTNSSGRPSHTDGIKISHPRWDEKIPREGFENPHGGTKRSQGRDEMIPTEGFPNIHVAIGLLARLASEVFEEGGGGVATACPKRRS